MRSVRGIVGAIVILVVLAGMWWQRDGARNTSTGSAPAASSRTSEPGASETPSPAPDAAPSTPRQAGASVAFRSREQLVEHFHKHGREFGAISQDEYLKRAQELRDRPAGGVVLERERTDGVITRFDRVSGAFLAVNPDGTIRTFFRPNQGEKYFWRQLERRH